MGLSKVWVYAETEGEKVKTITLEMLAKARELGDTVEAIYEGDASSIAEASPPYTASTESPSSRAFASISSVIVLTLSPSVSA